MLRGGLRSATHPIWVSISTPAWRLLAVSAGSNNVYLESHVLSTGTSDLWRLVSPTPALSRDFDLS